MHESQRIALQAIYDGWNSDGTWPRQSELIRRLVQADQQDAARALDDLPDEFARRDPEYHGALRLRLRGVHLIAPGGQEMRDYFALFSRCRERYRAKEASRRIELAEVEAALGSDASRLARLGALWETHEFVNGPHMGPDGTSWEVNDGILDYLTVADIGEFMAAYERRHAQVLDTARATADEEVAQASAVNPRRVFVVHGRNTDARVAMVALLRAFGLEPVLFRDVKARLGKPMPYIGEVLQQAFVETHATVVLFTPDDEVQLRAEFVTARDPAYERELTGQARPNVLLEAGMAMVAHRDRALLVYIGTVRPLTDLEGLHVLHFDGSVESRQGLAVALGSAHCPIDYTGPWLHAGDFGPGLRRATHDSPRGPDVTVTLESAAPTPVVDLGAGALDEWIAEARRHYLEPVPSSDAVSATMYAIGERRPVSEYRASVEKYLAEARDELSEHAVATLMESCEPRARLRVQNLTERNYVQLEVRLHLPPDAQVYAEADEGPRPRWFPKAPRRYGVPAPSPWDFGTILPPPHLPTPTPPEPRFAMDRESDGIVVIFERQTLGPRRADALPAIFLTLGAAREETMDVRWSATCPGVDGVREGTLTLTLLPAVHPRDLLRFDGRRLRRRAE